MTGGLPERQDERGMVLLVVLLVVALLVTILVEFSFSTLVDLRLAETYRDTIRAHYLANGGVRVGRAILQEDVNVYDGPDELWAQGVENYPVADGTVSIRIEDLGGKLDLNRLTDVAQSTVFRDRYLRLLELLGVDEAESLKDALIDWTDADDEKQPNGAESFFYLSLDNPYNCKNAPLESLEELLLVRGYDENLLQLLRPHVTVNGSDKLNINTATAEVIQVWNEEAPPDAGQSIVESRQRQPFTLLSQVNALSGLETFLTTYLAIDSNFYRIESTAFVNDGRRTIRVSVRKDTNAILYKRIL